MNEEGTRPYTHLILLTQDEVGQLRTVVDSPLKSVNVDRKDDGTGHIYAEFGPQLSREAVEKILEAREAQDTTTEVVSETIKEAAKVAKANGRKKPKAAGKSKEPTAQV